MNPTVVLISLFAMAAGVWTFLGNVTAIKTVLITLMRRTALQKLPTLRAKPIVGPTSLFVMVADAWTWRESVTIDLIVLMVQMNMAAHRKFPRTTLVNPIVVLTSSFVMAGDA